MSVLVSFVCLFVVFYFAKRKRRQSFCLQGALKPTREGHFFEVFLILGLPADFPVEDNEKATVPQEPQVLYSYPPSFEYV